MTEPIRSYTPTGMTPEKLLWIAEWLDVADDALDRLGDLYGKSNRPELKARLEEARGTLPRNEIQNDLRAWAAELETQHLGK